ncbi:MAG: type I restriction enzyme HsdR N-terminal domain-containing protein [Bacteroidales bacterium]|nr:type I restriction enzyme HsdR N-terminal domain-containing protein [Bacteroidales bacterium]
MVALALPPINIAERVSADGGKIFDDLRQRWVTLTPEEWVRQHFTAWLRMAFGYPATMMANEVSLRLNGMLRRCDTLVYDRALRPRLIVEYKAPEVPITLSVFDQIARYNMVINAPWLIVSNGRSHYCCHYDGPQSYSFATAIPPYSEL